MRSNNKIIGASALALLIGLGIGWLLFGGTGSTEHQHTENAENQTWTCSMHPDVRQQEPGSCPICGMDLIPVSDQSGNTVSSTAVAMSETARKIADVQTAVVQTGEATAGKQLQLSGKIQSDERRVVSQAAHIGGRVEQLSVSFTGDFVRKGNPLAVIYSPQLATDQQELLQAYANREQQPGLYRATYSKLLNQNITKEQIERVLETGKPINNFPVLATTSGYVTKKKVNEGDYVRQGQSLFEVADLSVIWALFEVYEQNLGMVQRGDSLSFSVQAYPGQTFRGVVTYIDPVINPDTRVARVRVSVRNDGRLKPGMLAQGLVSTASNSGNGLVVPRSAVLWTGKRSVVYVRESTQQETAFNLREVELGQALNNHYEVIAGLSPGEEVVVNGAFSVDAAAQLAGKPSMMNPPEQEQQQDVTEPVIEEPQGPLSGEAQKALQEVISTYLALKQALAADKEEEAVHQSGQLLSRIEEARSTSLGESKAWKRTIASLEGVIGQFENPESISRIREQFIPLSESIISLVKTHPVTDDTLYVQHCPMANNDQGADWLSSQEEVLNPYYGAQMLRCGYVKETLAEK
jgi:membrane fusion protein, copper/silver efflux system